MAKKLTDAFKALDGADVDTTVAATEETEQTAKPTGTRRTSAAAMVRRDQRRGADASVRKSMMAALKAQEYKTKVISVRFTPELIGRLDAMAEDLGIQRAVLIDRSLKWVCDQYDAEKAEK